jgi:uncharacterized protein (TIGR00288 family)
LTAQTNTRIALLIDADNAPATAIQKILSELARYGKVSIRRAYGNWASQNLKGWEAVLHEHAIQPIQQFALTKGKNATDIAIAIDAMDILYTKQVDVFSIVTSDCDFTPVVTRVLSEGKTVIGFGERKAPSPLVNACSTFLFLDDEPTDTAQASPTENLARRSSNELKGDTKLMNLLRDAISSTADDDGWAQLSRIGSHISNHASFDPRNYGYERLSELIAAIDLFKLKRDAHQRYIVRDSKRNH